MTISPDEGHPLALLIDRPTGPQVFPGPLSAEIDGTIRGKIHIRGEINVDELNTYDSQPEVAFILRKPQLFWAKGLIHSDFKAPLGEG